MNGVLSGIFLGGGGTPPPAPGDWVGRYGADGYVLGAWNGTSDVVVLPTASFSVVQGNRYQWSAGTGDLRALENAAETERRAATLHHDTSLRLRLTFTTAYSGDLHLYAVDWDALGRQERITVDDGSGPRSVNLTSFTNGAWVHFPISVAAGGSVSITVDKTAGMNGVLSGIFLGGP
jgi:hypothetical protein